MFLWAADDGLCVRGPDPADSTVVRNCLRYGEEVELLVSRHGDGGARRTEWRRVEGDPGGCLGEGRVV